VKSSGEWGVWERGDSIAQAPCRLCGAAHRAFKPGADHCGLRVAHIAAGIARARAANACIGARAAFAPAPLVSYI